MIAEACLALNYGASAQDVAETCHAVSTLLHGEATAPLWPSRGQPAP